MTPMNTLIQDHKMLQDVGRSDLTAPGRFTVGCNYWASHAGTHMWRDWRPEVVDRDLERLAAEGLQLLRVFPLWPDFQPITQLYTGAGNPREVRFGEEPLPDDEAGACGMSQAAMDRFAEFLDMTEKHGLSCLVGLITGWMSGRLYVPPALERLNVITDPLAIQWQVRFVRHFVGTFRDRPAVAAWDLGNECNCMGRATRQEAFLWTASIANAIRAADPSRPVVSGMHSLKPEGPWSMQDQGELTDLLTTHPYPVFTPHCDQDPVNTIRTILHSTAESRYYADLGGKPCLCQEIGTLGPMVADETTAADFARSCLFSLWANDCHGLLWWCANDQTELCHAPYDWSAVERELGLLSGDGSPKPVLREIGRFRAFLDGLPFRALPGLRREAVCILTEGQDHWGVAYSAFILAKQAGFDIEFQYADQPIREAELYLLPSLRGHSMIPRRRLMDLLARVEAGATLYMSLDDGMPSHFEKITGLQPQTREARRDGEGILFESPQGWVEIPNASGFKLRLTPTRARVLAAEADGNPAFTVADYGRGRVFFLGTPLEAALACRSGVFHTDGAPPCWRIYRHLLEGMASRRVVRKEQAVLAVTEHEEGPARRIIVAINQSPAEMQEVLRLEPGWSAAECFHGTVGAGVGLARLEVPSNDAVVFAVEKARAAS